MTKSIALSGGQVLTMRPPTEDELLKFLDKRAIVGRGLRVSGDIHDDGDYELAACVTAPTGEALEELLEDFPLANERLRDVFLELGGYNRPFREAPDLITDQHRIAGKRLVCYEVDGAPQPEKKPRESAEHFAERMAIWEKDGRGTPIVLTKLSRYEAKTAEMEAREAGYGDTPLPSAMAKLVRQHVVSGSPAEQQKVRDLLAGAPMLVASLGRCLLNAARLKIEEAQGKS